MHLIFKEYGLDHADLYPRLTDELIMGLRFDRVTIDEGAVGFTEVAHEVATVPVRRDLHVLGGDASGLDGDLSGGIGTDDDRFWADLVLGE